VIATRLSGQNQIELWDYREFEMRLPYHFFDFLYGGRSDDPSSGPTRRGNAFLKAGDHVSAIEQFSEAIRLNPRCAGAHNNRAAARWELGDHDAAIKDLSEALQIDPHNALALFNRSVMWSHVGNLSDALNDLSDLISVSRKDTEVIAFRGYLYMQQRNFDAAIADYTDVIRMNRGDSSTFVNRGYAWWMKGDVDAAIADCTQAISLNPKDSSAYAYRGLYRSQGGEYAAAAEDFNEALRLNPSDSDCCNNFAWQLSTCPEGDHRDGKKAVELATTACEQTKYLTWYCVETLAAAYAELSDWENSIRCQQQAIDLVADENEKEAGQKRVELYKSKKPYREEPRELR
jgi:tetratricopeptide (TPR) repeat protein